LEKMLRNQLTPLVVGLGCFLVTVGGGLTVAGVGAQCPEGETVIHAGYGNRAVPCLHRAEGAGCSGGDGGDMGQGRCYLLASQQADEEAQRRQDPEGGVWILEWQLYWKTAPPLICCEFFYFLISIN
jgi:hypothetical protein